MKSFIKSVFKNICHHKWLYLSIFVVIFGVFLTYANSAQEVRTGDPATFASFGCNISKGEVIYKDFYHFRTPGEYFVNGLFAKIRGCGLKSTLWAASITGYIFAPLIAVWAVWLFNRKISLAALVYFVLISNTIASQFRIVLGFLAIAFLVNFIKNGLKKKKYASLYLCGLSLGVCFMFGQDIAIIAGFTIFSTMLYVIFAQKHKIKIIDSTYLFLRIAAGFMVGVLPLLIYLVVTGSFVKGLYYIFYYAIFLQPNGMDLPFPPLLTEGGFGFYIPITLISILFMQILNMKHKNFEEIAILIWSIVRFISAAGRSDDGYLIFGILPEIIILIWMVLKNLNITKVSKRSLIDTVAFATVFIIAIFVKSFLLFGLAILALVVIYLSDSSPSRKIVKIKTDKMRYFVIIIATILIYSKIAGGFFLLIQNSSKGLFERKEEIQKNIPLQETRVGANVMQKNPKTIFAYPILPYYYTLGIRHATPFMTFEPQTTLAEQEEAIEYLKNNRPEVVVFDPLQAYDLGKSLSLITDYILNNYKIESLDQDKHTVWVMVSRDKPLSQNYIALNVKKYRNNENLISVENAAQKIYNGLLQKPKTNTKLSGFGNLKKISFEPVLFDKNHRQQVNVVLSDGSLKSVDINNSERQDLFFENKTITQIEIINESNDELVLKGVVGE